MITTKYIYAGFSYIIIDAGSLVTAFPSPGQHPAANKYKHRQAAVDCWIADGKPLRIVKGSSGEAGTNHT